METKRVPTTLVGEPHRVETVPFSVEEPSREFQWDSCRTASLHSSMNNVSETEGSCKTVNRIRFYTPSQRCSATALTIIHLRNKLRSGLMLDPGGGTHLDDEALYL